MKFANLFDSNCISFTEIALLDYFKIIKIGGNYFAYLCFVVMFLVLSAVVMIFVVVVMMAVVVVMMVVVMV
jgi:hypothetical protein